MGKRYDDFVEESNKKLATILSSPKLEDKEKQLIVNDISNELLKHVNTPDDIPDIDYIIYRSSLLFLDEEITTILNSPEADKNDYYRGFTLCERLQLLHSLFSEKKWSLPQVEQKDPEKSNHELEKRLHALTVIEEIHSLDKQLTVLISEAAVSIDRKKCEEASNCLQKLQEYILDAEKNGIIYGSISNSDLTKCATAIDRATKEVNKKEELDAKLINNDSIICDSEIKGDADEKCWSEAIKLSKKQEDIISEYQTKGWHLPKLKRKKMAEVRDQFQTYQEMVKTDQLIRHKAEITNADSQYYEFIDICNKQSANLEKCKTKNWRIPGKIIVDFDELKDNVYSKVEEKTKERQKRILKTKIIIITIAALILGALIIIGGKYFSTLGKKQSPYNSSDIIGEKYDEVFTTFYTSGFENVYIEEDTGGWLSDGKVTRVKIGDITDFTRNQYFGEREKVTVYFSSQGRKDVSNLLEGWQKTDPQELAAKVEQAGLKNVRSIEKGTTEKSVGNQIFKIRVNGLTYESGPCYIPLSAPIEIEYYVYRIVIGRDTNTFSGKDYNQVYDELTAKGYKNVQTEAVNSGWKKGNAVIDVSVNGSVDYNAADMFPDDAKIVIRYSSDNRIDVTTAIKDWKKEKYSKVRNALTNLGLKKVKVSSTKTQDIALHNTIANIKIEKAIYDSGDCFVSKDSEVLISYYRAVRKIGKDKNAVNGHNYLEVKRYLTNKGFTNIVLKRTDDLSFVKEAGFLWLFGGQVDKNVRTIKINGDEDFDAEDEFYIDTEIVLLVNTYGGNKYEGM